VSTVNHEPLIQRLDRVLEGYLDLYGSNNRWTYAGMAATTRERLASAADELVRLLDEGADFYRRCAEYWRTGD
jgi:hypothetical protein